MGRSLDQTLAGNIPNIARWLANASRNLRSCGVSPVFGSATIQNSLFSPNGSMARKLTSSTTNSAKSSRPPNRREGCSRITFDPGMVRTTRVTPRRVIKYLLMAKPVRIPPSLCMFRVFTVAGSGSLLIEFWNSKHPKCDRSPQEPSWELASGTSAGPSV